MSAVECSLIDNMCEVSRDDFFRFIGGPWDIHPNPCQDWFEWKINGSGRIIGVSFPGYKNPGGVKRYFIQKDAK